MTSPSSGVADRGDDATPHGASRPLSQVRVIDVTSGPMGTASRLLAELGAEVLRIAPRDAGTGSRSATGMSRHLGKACGVFDPTVAAARMAFDRLVAGADILIEDRAQHPLPGELLDPARLHSLAPHLVIASISPFGQTGAYSGWQGTGAIYQAMSGMLSNSGLPGCPPLLPPADLVHASATPHIASYILFALLNRLRRGVGDHLDISMLDTAAVALDPAYGMGGSAGAGLAPANVPRGRIDARFQYPIFACADGHIRLCVLKPGQWRGMFRWMGSPAAFADPSFDTLSRRFGSTELTAAMAAFVAPQTRAELEAAAEAHGVPAAGVRTVDEALASEQIVARNAIARLDSPGVDTATFPNGVMEIDGARMTPTPSRTPVDIAAFSWREREPFSPMTDAAADGPLTGLRVLDLGVIVAGGDLGRLLADMGADVVKVESAQNPDGSRQTRDGTPMSRSFAAGHRNKRSLAIDLRDAVGAALFVDLARRADILLSNFKPGTLDKLGLGVAPLAAVNPRLIQIESSAFGASGPWRGKLGYGPLVRAAMGLTARWCYPGDEGSFSDAITIYPDHAAARTGVVAVLALLVRRFASGTGGHASIAQSEVILNGIAGDVARVGAGESANALDISAWPRGVFSCAGDDEWCVVDVRDHRDWRALCEVIGCGKAERDSTEAALSAWTRSRSPQEVEHLLQAAGVPAARMLRPADLPGHPYFAGRGLFRPVEHALFETPLTHETRAVVSHNLPLPPERPAPMLGDHSREVIGEWLGLSADKTAALLAKSIIHEVDLTPDASALKEPA